MQGKGIAAPLDIAGLCFEGELAVVLGQGDGFGCPFACA